MIKRKKNLDDAAQIMCVCDLLKDLNHFFFVRHVRYSIYDDDNARCGMSFKQIISMKLEWEEMKTKSM